MSGERWIVIDTKPGPGDTYLGRNGWQSTVRKACPFERREDAVAMASRYGGCVAGRIIIRRVVPAGTSRTHAAAKAAEDTVATMRAELDGLRATDAECAARLAAVTAERDAAVRDLADLREAIATIIASARGA